MDKQLIVGVESFGRAEFTVRVTFKTKIIALLLMMLQRLLGINLELAYKSALVLYAYVAVEQLVFCLHVRVKGFKTVQVLLLATVLQRTVPS